MSLDSKKPATHGHDGLQPIVQLGGERSEGSLSSRSNQLQPALALFAEAPALAGSTVFSIGATAARHCGRAAA